jgi:hypothetical protein
MPFHLNIFKQLYFIFRKSAKDRSSIIIRVSLWKRILAEFSRHKSDLCSKIRAKSPFCALKADCDRSSVDNDKDDAVNMTWICTDSKKSSMSDFPLRNGWEKSRQTLSTVFCPVLSTVFLICNFKRSSFVTTSDSSAVVIVCGHKIHFYEVCFLS